MGDSHLTSQQPIASPFGAHSTAAEVLDGIDLVGKSAVVTGGSAGLGLETTRALAAAGATVLVPARRPDQAQHQIADLPGVQVIAMDLADLNSVARAARLIAAITDRLDILVAAAGVMATPQRPVGPGWDYQLAVNHLGHFALTTQLYPLLSQSDSARVVVYSSAGHHASSIRWDDMHFRSGYDKWAAYGQSKTANVLFAQHLDLLGREEGVRAFSLHPGKIITGLQRDIPITEQVHLGWVDETGAVVGKDFKSPSQGAATGLWAATTPLLHGRGGLYLQDCNIAPIAGPHDSMDDGGVQPYAIDPPAARHLWRISSAITATDLPSR